MTLEALALECMNDRHIDGNCSSKGLRYPCRYRWRSHAIMENIVCKTPPGKRVLQSFQVSSNGTEKLKGQLHSGRCADMWYVMQVTSGQENRTVFLVEEIISRGTLEDCFVPVRRLKKKFRGAWHEVTEKLFPGYVFMISEQPWLLYEELKQVPALTRMLGRCEEYFTPLSEKDVWMMEKLRNGVDDGGNLEVEISKVAVEEGKQVRVLSGPLMDLRGQIKKVNLHKRIAEVEMEFMGDQILINFGIEII